MECRKCRTENPATNKFCGECGCELTEGPNLQDVTLGMEGERKQATVLFSDLSSYTAMTEKLDPEEVKTILGRIFVEASKVVEKYEGTVERFFGDEIMALFGVPLAHEDDPVRAIHAAGEIHDLVAAMSTDFEKRNKMKLLMHTGINTGLMVTGDKRIGKSRYGLTGDTVNVAKKLTGNAKPGEILVGPRTYQQSEGFFFFEPLGSTSIKGKQIRLRTYKILGRRKYIQRPRIGVERQVYSEMVGRNEELDTLNRQLIRMIEGNGSVVNVIGEAGIGKSRLLTEFKNLETCKRVVLLKGKAISIGRNLAFHPIVDLLKHWARIAEDDSEASALNKLESAIRSVCEEEAEGIFPFVAILVGMKLSGKHADRIKDIEGEALEKMILKNVRDLLIRASKRRPLVIVMEDLHWADGSSIELLKSLFRLADQQRILFINIFRPGHQVSGDNRVIEALQGHPAVEHVEIRLEPLDESLSEELIGNMLRTKGAPHAVARQIAKRAGGNPFFIEEIILSFIDEGALVFKNGRFGMSNKAAAMEVPHTIHDVLNARIDRLEKETRNLVKIASVIGKNFFYRILTNVATAIEDIDNRLSYLKRIQLILERVRLGELEFFFKHALVQEAAYKSILHDKRKALHLRVAKTIESLFKKRLHEFYGMLALHYNRGQDYENAEYYLTKAGEEALKSSASKEALHYYQEALNLFLKEADGPADSEKQAMFEKNIALALYYRGRYDEAVDYFDKALSFYWGRLPGNAFSLAYRFSWAFFHILISLYSPFLKFRKTATREDIQNLELFYNKSKALAIINPQRQS